MRKASIARRPRRDRHGGGCPIAAFGAQRVAVDRRSGRFQPPGGGFGSGYLVGHADCATDEGPRADCSLNPTGGGAEDGSAFARSQVMEAWRIADLHAYVDDCLEPDPRLAFEQQMAEDPALARRSALWRAQNSAIRAAFEGEGARAFSISIVRHHNERSKQRSDGRPGSAANPSEQPTQLSSPATANASRFSAKATAPYAFRSLAFMATGTWGIVRLPCVHLGSGRDRCPRQGTWKGRRGGFPGVHPLRSRTRRIRDQRQDRICKPG